MATHTILSFYYFVALEDPHLEVQRQRAYLEGRDVRSRIYISYEGINGQMSIACQEADAYIEWLRSDPRFAKIDFKIESHFEHVFPRLTIKFRQQLVALDAKPNYLFGGERLSPREWKERLERRDEDTLLLDVRNDYEWRIGHFEGAQLPKLNSFRQFPEFAKRLKVERDPQNTQVLMYCTGGIRCELFSALLKEVGFQHVYQLDGGVIRYGQQEGGKHWLGKLFVFDDRLAVPLHSPSDTQIISMCHSCQASSDTYYNCANMDCNELFILCLACAEKNLGCCSEACKLSKRRRPYERAERPKPFRKGYQYSLNPVVD